MLEERVECWTPTPGKQGTRILKWKYDLVRNAILKVVPKDKTGVKFNQLTGLLESVLGKDELGRLGSLRWYTTTVKLDMEVRGEIERIPNSSPQKLRRVS